ncbi:hypothetical protein L4D08_17480 [Photobacterium chitinilyticum]|uniref:hypothetical protein n=1 Tax=Photobacterium chitinilyticum TaxID=2485123 RepID=UPI003D126D0F
MQFAFGLCSNVIGVHCNYYGDLWSSRLSYDIDIEAVVAHSAVVTATDNKIIVVRDCKPLSTRGGQPRKNQELFLEPARELSGN